MRQKHGLISSLMKTVSIHASVKDATLQTSIKFNAHISFNPRICKRCDKYAIGLKEETEVSIHASVKDATLPILMLGTVGGFNPRICKRCDTLARLLRICALVSIHASVKDATDSLLPKWLTYRVSIHASVKDATMPMMFPIQTKMFQSTHL